MNWEKKPAKVFISTTKTTVISVNGFHIAPLNEMALLVSFGNCIDEAINKRVIDLCNAIYQNPFPGFIEAVPAYSSLSIFYDVLKVRQSNPAFATAFDATKNYILQLLPAVAAATNSEKRKINIPVLYNGDDLHIIAAEKNISAEEVIRLHTAVIYRVYMIGFLPGFAYLGSVDERIAMPRKQTPRTHVPAGSVGIAGRQTGIYPLTSPGGWQLIGKTPLKIFDKEKKLPCLLKAGDEVQFISIKQQEFNRLNEY